MSNPTILRMRQRLLRLSRTAAALGSSVHRGASASPFSRLRRRIGVIVSVFAMGITGVAAAVVSYSVTTKATSGRHEISWAENTIDRQPSDGALFVHTKLMQVRTSRTGIPVLRIVECRHYAKQHKKLIQTGFTPSGTPVYQFVPGDYCIFAAQKTVFQKSSEIGTYTQTPQGAQSAIKVVDLTATLPGIGLNRFGRRLTAYQQYACEKFGPACRVALAIQAAENVKGACEAYHYNTDGTLDWGYFQINTVHLTRRGVNLRDLLDCKANIDFAYQLYKEEGFQPWTTYTNGEYRRFIDDFNLASRGNSTPIPRPDRLLIAGYR